MRSIEDWTHRIPVGSDQVILDSIRPSVNVFIRGSVGLAQILCRRLLWGDASCETKDLLPQSLLLPFSYCQRQTQTTFPAFSRKPATKLTPPKRQNRYLKRLLSGLAPTLISRRSPTVPKSDLLLKL